MSALGYYDMQLLLCTSPYTECYHNTESHQQYSCSSHVQSHECALAATVCHLGAAFRFWCTTTRYNTQSALMWRCLWL